MVLKSSPPSPRDPERQIRHEVEQEYGHLVIGKKALERDGEDGLGEAESAGVEAGDATAAAHQGEGHEEEQREVQQGAPAEEVVKGFEVHEGEAWGFERAGVGAAGIKIGEALSLGTAELVSRPGMGVPFHRIEIHPPQTSESVRSLVPSFLA